MGWVGNVAYTGRKEMYTGLVVKPEEKGLLERPRSRWVDNVKMDIK